MICCEMIWSASATRRTSVMSRVQPSRWRGRSVANGQQATAAPRGLTNRALGGMIWTFSGTGVQAVIQLLALMALGRLLSPSEFGLMGAAAVVIAFSQIISQV